MMLVSVAIAALPVHPPINDYVHQPLSAVAWQEAATFSSDPDMFGSLPPMAVDFFIGQREYDFDDDSSFGFLVTPSFPQMSNGSDGGHSPLPLSFRPELGFNVFGGSRYGFSFDVYGLSGGLRALAPFALSPELEVSPYFGLGASLDWTTLDSYLRGDLDLWASIGCAISTSVGLRFGGELRLQMVDVFDFGDDALDWWDSNYDQIALFVGYGR